MTAAGESKLNRTRLIEEIHLGAAFSSRVRGSAKSEGGVVTKADKAGGVALLKRQPSTRGPLLQFSITYLCFAAALPASNGSARSAETCFPRAWMPRQYFRGSIPRAMMTSWMAMNVIRVPNA
jgi:hypothetical protein